MESWRKTILFFLCFGAGLWTAGLGCKKTESPFNVYAPSGLDVPSPTPLPLSGAIVVNVSDGSKVVSDLTVEAIIPGGGVTLTGTTNGGGQVAFDPDPLAPGIWTLQIPKQTNAVSDYGLSQDYVTIGPDFTNATVNFNPGAFSGSVSAVAGSSYPTTLQNNLVFDVSVSQTGNLNIPVTYAFVGLPFSVNPGSVTLDMQNPQQSVTVQVPSCSVSEPIFRTDFYRTGSNSNIGSSSSVTITRSYPVTISDVTRVEHPDCETIVNRSGTTHVGSSMNDTWELDATGACPGMPFNVHVAFTSTNNSSSSTPKTEDFTLYSGTPYTFNWLPTTTSPVQYAVTITDPNNPANVYAGGFTFDPHFGSGGSCNCGNGGYTGCQSATTITAFTNQVVNP